MKPCGYAAKKFIEKTMGPVWKKEWVRVLFYVVMLFCYIKPSRLNEFAYPIYRICSVVNWATVCIMLVVLFLAYMVYRQRPRVCGVVGCVLVLALIALSTILAGNSYGDIVKRCVRYTVLLLFVGYLIQKDRRALLKSLMIVFGAYTVSDFIAIFIAPNGLYIGVWPDNQPYFVTGHKNGMIMYSLLFTVAVMKYEWPKKTYRYAMMAICAILLLFTQILGKSLTGTMVAVILIVGMLVYLWNPKFLILRAEFVTLAMLVITCVLVFGRVSEVFSAFFDNVLHRDGTLNSRTIVWSMLLPHIRERLLLGYGIESLDTVHARMYLSYPHNTILGALYYAGVLGLLAYIETIVTVTRNITRKRFTAIGKFELFALCALLTECMVEERIMTLQSQILLVILALDTYQNHVKVAFASSCGGHNTELMGLKPLMKKYDSILVTEKTDYNTKDTELKCYYVEQVMRKDRSRLLLMLRNTLRYIGIIIKEDPDIVVTTGVLAVIPFCILMKLFGKRMIYIESFCRVTTPTKTGKLLYRFADASFIQWDELQPCYPRAEYKGGLL